MMHVYIIISTDDPHCEDVITLMAESDDQALQMGSDACCKPLDKLGIYSKAPILGLSRIVDYTTNHYNE